MNLQPYFVKCPNCGRLPEPNRPFCPGCGRPLEMYDEDDRRDYNRRPRESVQNSPYWQDDWV